MFLSLLEKHNYISNKYKSPLLSNIYQKYGILSPLYHLIMYVFWDFPPLHQRITPRIHPKTTSTPRLHQKTPCHISTLSSHPTCKNAQYPSYHQIHAIILYYYSMFCHPRYIYIFSNRSISPRAGMCSTHTST